MGGKAILLCSTDAPLAHALEAALVSISAELLHADSQLEAIGALDSGVIDLVLVDLPNFSGGLGLLDVATTCVASIALSEGHDLNLLSSLFCNVGSCNVHRRPEEPYDEDSESFAELVSVVRKRLGSPLFGLAGYEPDAGVWQRAILTGAGQRDNELEKLRDFLSEHKAPRMALTSICNATDEMITNAIYNAPVDDSGRPRYASTDRKIKVELDEDEEVELCYGLSGGRFVVSVGDNFGRLRRRHLANSIRRCVLEGEMIEEKDGGAGLGLFMIARTAHEFAIHVDPGNRTEVVAMWKLDRKRLREHRAYNSLHVFKHRTPRRRSRGQHRTEFEGATTDPGIF